MIYWTPTLNSLKSDHILCYGPACQRTYVPTAKCFSKGDESPLGLAGFPGGQTGLSCHAWQSPSSRGQLSPLPRGDRRAPIWSLELPVPSKSTEACLWPYRNIAGGMGSLPGRGPFQAGAPHEYFYTRTLISNLISPHPHLNPTTNHAHKV